MEVGQGPNWGCSAKGKKNMEMMVITKSIRLFIYHGNFGKVGRSKKKT
jgi:hypothetical protein